MIEGNLPKKQMKLELAWAELHQEELMHDWNLVMNGEEPFKIQPLQYLGGFMYPALNFRHSAAEPVRAGGFLMTEIFSKR
jgi:hypothetical protein